MEFFEKIGKKASETFNSAGEKANKIAVETKLKFKINDCKSKIKEQYQEIGKKVYQRYVLDGNINNTEDIADELSKISALTDEIEACEKQILELANMKQCVECKNKIEMNAKYCPECGKEQPKEEVHEVEVVQENNDTTDNVDNCESNETTENMDAVQSEETVENNEDSHNNEYVDNENDSEN